MIIGNIKLIWGLFIVLFGEELYETELIGVNFEYLTGKTWVANKVFIRNPETKSEADYSSFFLEERCDTTTFFFDNDGLCIMDKACYNFRYTYTVNDKANLITIYTLQEKLYLIFRVDLLTETEMKIVSMSEEETGAEAGMSYHLVPQ